MPQGALSGRFSFSRCSAALKVQFNSIGITNKKKINVFTLPSGPGVGHDSPRMEARAVFQSTLWSVVLQAREGSAEERRAALQRLCQTYWPPLYAYLLRKGRSPD